MKQLLPRRRALWLEVDRVQDVHRSVLYLPRCSPFWLHWSRVMPLEQQCCPPGTSPRTLQRLILALVHRALHEEACPGTRRGVYPPQPVVCPLTRNL